MTPRRWASPTPCPIPAQEKSSMPPATQSLWVTILRRLLPAAMISLILDPVMPPPSPDPTTWWISAVREHSILLGAVLRRPLPALMTASPKTDPANQLHLSAAALWMPADKVSSSMQAEIKLFWVRILQQRRLAAMTPRRWASPTP